MGILFPESKIFPGITIKSTLQTSRNAVFIIKQTLINKHQCFWYASHWSCQGDTRFCYHVGRARRKRKKFPFLSLGNGGRISEIANYYKEANKAEWIFSAMNIEQAETRELNSICKCLSFSLKLALRFMSWSVLYFDNKQLVSCTNCFDNF